MEGATFAIAVSDDIFRAGDADTIRWAGERTLVPREDASVRSQRPRRVAPTAHDRPVGPGGGRRGVRGLLVTAFLSAIAAGACASGASAGGDVPGLPSGVRAELEEEYYTVFGTTVPDIGRSMTRRGPPARNHLAWGRHSWDFEREMEWAPGPDGCAVGDLRIDLRSTITLPRWVERGGAERELQLMWDEFMVALREHEDRHRRYALEAATEIYTQTALMTAPDCRRLSSAIQARTRAILDHYDQLNRDFDAQSRGVVRWPPR